MSLAILAENSVGNAMASSKALVWRDWVPPNAAASASTHVRVTLLNGSCCVSDQPEVWQWVRRAMDLGFFGLNCFTNFAHNIRPARIFAISIKWFMPIPQKKEIRGAKSSISKPAFNPDLMYSRPSARV